jgi:hypothetical protein
MATVTGMAGAIMGMAMAGAIMVTAMVGAAEAATHPVAVEVEEAEEVGVEGEEVVVVEEEEEEVVEAEAVAGGSEPDGPTLVASSSKFAGNKAQKHE